MLCLSERKISAGISEYQIFKLTIIRIGIGLKKKKLHLQRMFLHGLPFETVFYLQSIKTTVVSGAGSCLKLKT